MTLTAEMTDSGLLGAMGNFNPVPNSLMSPLITPMMPIFPRLSPSSSKDLSSTSLLSPSPSSSSSSMPSSVFITQVINLTFFVRNSSSEKSLSSSSSTLNLKYSSSYSSSLDTPTTTPISTSTRKPITFASSLLSLKKSKSVRLKSEDLNTERDNEEPRSMEDSTGLRLFESINYNIGKYVDPVVLTFGTLCNLLFCLVFLGTPLKSRPLSHVHTGIGIIDLTYVISCIIIHLSKKGEPVYDTPGVCQITTFTLTVSRSLQTWFVFISHFDRLHSHFTYSEASRKRRVYNTKFALIIVTLMVVAPSVHVLWSYEVHTMYGRSFCVPMKHYIQFHIIMRKIHIVGCVIVPIALTLGIDLFFGLKLSLHLFCSMKEYDDGEDDTENLGVYQGYKISNDSSFCTDKIVQLPLQDKKTESCEHLLGKANVETPCRPTHQNLSTIVENSSDHFPTSQRTSVNSQYNSRSVNTDNKRNENDRIPENEVDDKFSTIQRKYPYDPKRKVARYILTSTQNCSQDEINENKLEYCSKIKQEEKSPNNNKLTVESNNKYSEKENSSRLSGTPSKRQSGNNDNNNRDAQFSVFSSSIRKSYTQNSLSVSQYQSYNYTSVASNVSRITVIPQDHIFSSDVTSGSVTTILIGLVLCGLIIPSACVEGKVLFFPSSSTMRPSPLSIQKAMFYESLVLINSAYKIIMFVLFMKSFRQAVVFFLSSCVPNRTSSSSICSLSSDSNKNDKDSSIV